MIALISDSQSKTLFDNSKLLIIVNKKEIPKIGFLFDCPEILFKERDRIGRTQMFRKCIREITLRNKVTNMMMYFWCVTRDTFFVLLLRKASSASLVFFPTVFATVLNPISLLKLVSQNNDQVNRITDAKFTPNAHSPSVACTPLLHSTSDSIEP